MHSSMHRKGSSQLLGKHIVQKNSVTWNCKSW